MRIGSSTTAVERFNAPAWEIAHLAVRVLWRRTGQGVERFNTPLCGPSKESKQ